MNPVEEFIKRTYENHIKNKPTFDENMQKQIERELQRLVDEANAKKNNTN
jgi:hypothetical protein